MSQSYSSNCFSTANVIETDMQNVENNFDALRSLFSGSSAPTSPDAGQLWYDTGSSSVKIRYNSSWVEWWDMDGKCVAAGQVKTASLADGALTADAAGRGKMADGYITNAKVSDVDGSKIADNSIAGGKIQNNAISPSKLGAGVSNPIVFVPCGIVVDQTNTITAGYPPYINVQGLTQSYKTVWQCYLYIPDGVKYVILAGRISGGVGSQTVYLRLNVNGTTGAVVSAVGMSFANVSSSALDISGQAGAMRSVTIEAYSAAPATTMLSIAFLVVQFYGT